MQIIQTKDSGPDINQPSFDHLYTTIKNAQGNKLTILDSMMKDRGMSLTQLFHNFETQQLEHLLKNSEPLLMSSKGDTKSYELYSQVPVVLLIQGCVQLTYLDLEGDRQKLDSVDYRLKYSGHLIQVNKCLINCGIKQSDMNLLTGFRLSNPLGTPSLVLLIDSQKYELALENRQQLQVLRLLRNKETLNYYGLDTTQTTYSQSAIKKTTRLPQSPYIILLNGKILIMKDYTVLACYSQGIFSKVTNEQLGTYYILLPNSDVYLCQSVWKGQRYQEGEVRRIRHLECVIAKYKGMSEKEVKKIQKEFMKQNQIDEAELDGFLPKKKSTKTPHSFREHSEGPKLLKKNSQTSQSSQADDKITKPQTEKCTIRIRVKKK